MKDQNLGAPISIAGMEVKELPAFPEGGNPFIHDTYNMGSRVGNNCMVMYDKHPSERAGYVIIVNIATGKRIKVSL